MSNLITTEQEVRAVKAPPATESWFPFQHSILLDELHSAADAVAVVPSSTRYELSKDGNKFFGVWNFAEAGDAETPQVSVGFRNSIDKSMAVGITAGTYIVVCSNMAFSGQWLQFRKHTKNVLNDLRIFVNQSFHAALSISKREVKWQQQLDTVQVSYDQWKILTYDALRSGILALSKAEGLFVSNGYRTLGNWFNVVTRALSERSLIHTEDAFSRLRYLVEDFLTPDQFV